MGALNGKGKAKAGSSGFAASLNFSSSASCSLLALALRLHEAGLGSPGIVLSVTRTPSPRSGRSLNPARRSDKEQMGEDARRTREKGSEKEMAPSFFLIFSELQRSGEFLSSRISDVIAVSSKPDETNGSQDALPAECMEDEFCGAGGQRLEVRGYSSWQPGPRWTPARRHSAAGAGGAEVEADEGKGQKMFPFDREGSVPSSSRVAVRVLVDLPSSASAVIGAIVAGNVSQALPVEPESQWPLHESDRYPVRRPVLTTPPVRLHGGPSPSPLIAVVKPYRPTPVTDSRDPSALGPTPDGERESAASLADDRQVTGNESTLGPPPSTSDLSAPWPAPGGERESAAVPAGHGERESAAALVGHGERESATALVGHGERESAASLADDRQVTGNESALGPTPSTSDLSAPWPAPGGERESAAVPAGHGERESAAALVGHGERESAAALAALVGHGERESDASLADDRQVTGNESALGPTPSTSDLSAPWPAPDGERESAAWPAGHGERESATSPAGHGERESAASPAGHGERESDASPAGHGERESAAALSVIFVLPGLVALAEQLLLGLNCLVLRLLNSPTLHRLSGATATQLTPMESDPSAELRRSADQKLKVEGRRFVQIQSAEQKAVNMFRSLDNKLKMSWKVEVEPPEDMDEIRYDIDPRMMIWKSMTASGEDRKHQKAEEDLDELYHPSLDNLLNDRIQNMDALPADDIRAAPWQEDSHIKNHQKNEEDEDDVDPGFRKPAYEEPEQDWDEVYHKAREELDVYLAPLVAGYEAGAEVRVAHSEPEKDEDALYHPDGQGSPVQMELLSREVRD
ncbi:hypothetical protein EYF80_031443 [Liparis tanakae]|uniref:Uncharacterized protein n=1 Tax=Liparis tanakae TaxID=230148 RepID=A0A4Z2GYF5_9TELE|nr:hypothetical protein EYF80_031443 [Liparis tanakae]